MLTYSIPRKLLMFIIIYTLLSLLLMNGIYITNHTHKTSINIRFHQFKERSTDPDDEIIERTEYPVEDSTEMLRVTPKEIEELLYVAEEEDDEYLSYLENEMYDESINERNANEELEQSLGEQTNKSTKHLKKKKKYRPLFYDHPVLRRIEDVSVFYISAIADENSFRKLPASTQNEGMGNHVAHLKGGARSYEDHRLDFSHKSEMNTIDKSNWIKSRNFLQPLSLLSNNSWHGIVTLNGWEGCKNAKLRYFCCFRYDNDIESTEVQYNSKNIKDKRRRKKRRRKRHKQKDNYEDYINNAVSYSSLMMWKNIWNKINMNIIKAAQFVCPLIPKDEGSNTLPTKVALSDKENCQTKKPLKYIDIDRQFPNTGASIAVCAKLVYGNFSAERLIEWFEFNKLMGVDKIMLFTYDIVEDVKIVLDHYLAEGLLVIREFDIPAKTTFRRKPGGKNVMAFEDEQVTVFDCIERFNSFRFVAVLDLDEFLVPTEAINVTGTWRTMLSQLLTSHPDASGFVFQTQIFTLDWGVSNAAGNLFVSKYIKRTTTMWDRRKNIFLPERIQRGMVWTHSYTSAVAYNRIKVSPEIAKIFHYRNCRPDWIKHNTCEKGRAKIIDTTLLQVMERVENNILDTKYKLLRK